MTRNVTTRRAAARGAGVVLVAGLAGLGLPAIAVAAPPPGCTQAGTTVTCEFGPTGAERSFTVPDGVTSLRVRAVGAAGGQGDDFGDGPVPGGAGAAVTGDLTGLTPGSTLYLAVGGAGGNGTAGFNGGGPSLGSALGGGGGGASDVRTVSRNAGGTLESRLVVAGGGGGSGTDGTASVSGSLQAGAGGAAGEAGRPGTAFGPVAGGTGGGAGTATAGGAAGVGVTPPFGGVAGPGTLGQGGPGASGAEGGGGGGGLYGGGGGGNGSGGTSPSGVSAGGGGGGGSSLAPAGGSVAAATGPASITLSYDVAPVAGAIAATSGGGQSAQAGAAFAQPLVATVTDPGANVPVPGAPVTFTVTAGSASFPGGNTATVTTGSDGRATAPTLTAGSTAGPVTVTAATPGVAAPATFTGTVTAAPAADRADLAATLTVPATLRPGGSGPVTLVVRNAGPGPARSVASGIALPDGLTVTNGGGGAVSNNKRAVGFLAGTIAPNGSVTYTVTVTAAPSARGAKSIGGGVLSVATRDPNLGNNYQVKATTVR